MTTTPENALRKKKVLCKTSTDQHRPSSWRKLYGGAAHRRFPTHSRGVVGSAVGLTVGPGVGAEGLDVGACVSQREKDSWHARVPSQSSSSWQDSRYVHLLWTRHWPPQSTSVSYSGSSTPLLQ